ncbi:MAG: CDP-alcohol phosphatidyltransferase family protein [Promethearchaeota archaeon]
MNDIKESEKRTRQREISNRYINRPVEFLIKHNLTPNMISFIGFSLTLTGSFLVSIGWLYASLWFSWIVPAFLGLAGAFDLFDGEVARRTGNETPAGAYLDSNLDRLSDAILILGLIYGGLINFLLGYILLFLVIMISYTRSRAENEGINMKGVGFMERAERILFLLFTISIELIFYFSTLMMYGEPFTVYIPLITRVPVTPIFLIGIIIFIFTLVYTIIQRLSFTFRNLKNSNVTSKKK